MDFARRQLLKYGWTEGKGLGKNESGLAEALKPQLKFDTTGVGHDSSEQFTFNWWENVYNNAADNIQVVQTEDGVKVKQNSEESIDITTKKYSLKHLKKKNKNLEYGTFLKTSKLTAEGVVDHEDKVITTDDAVQVINTANLTDEQLFAACGGRTAHKGARHGLKLNGKLARIEEQEMLLLKKMKKQARDLETPENKMKKALPTRQYQLPETDNSRKHKKCKNKKKDQSEVDENESSTAEEKKKKKSKKRKHSISETETFIEEEAARKRTEYCCEKQTRKKLKIRKRKEDKKMSKIADMFENACVLDSQHEQNNKDDGFEESSKLKSKSLDDEDKAQIKKLKKLKKRRKLNAEIAKNSEDDGFEEYISEVNEKLIFYKELRKDLQNEKKKGDEKRIMKMTEDFEKKL